MVFGGYFAIEQEVENRERKVVVRSVANVPAGVVVNVVRDLVSAFKLRDVIDHFCVSFSA